MQQLIRRRRSRRIYSRTHKLNVMRAVFCDSRLSESVTDFLECALQKCFACLSLEAWSVRNAAAQLFASLIVRIFGVAHDAQSALHPHIKNTMSSYEFFARFCNLLFFSRVQQHKKKYVFHSFVFLYFLMLAICFFSHMTRL